MLSSTSLKEGERLAKHLTLKYIAFVSFDLEQSRAVSRRSRKRFINLGTNL